MMPGIILILSKMQTIIDQIKTVFSERGQQRYGSEAVTQQQHALQSAYLAEREGASAQLITAALLHDIGHILDKQALPNDDEQDLDDLHEEIAYRWLLAQFGQEVAAPVQLHVVAKRYLCTVDSLYINLLSPTSLKSYHDQGGSMSTKEVEDFRRHPYFEAATQLRRWDDMAKDPGQETPGLDHFLEYVEVALAT